MRLKLKVIQGALKSPDGRSLGAEIPVPTPRFVIGTADDCHMRCSGHSISPRHCTILVEDDRVVVRDESSEGGTFVNGLRIAPTACLFSGDRLRVGKLEFNVVISSGPSARIDVPVTQTRSTAVTSPTAQTLAAAPVLPSPEASVPAALPLSQRETVGGPTDTVANLVAEMLSDADEAERERRRFDPAAREYHPPTETTSKSDTQEAKPTVKLQPPPKRPPAKLPPPPPVRGQDTIDAAQQALSQLLSTTNRKKPE